MNLKLLNRSQENHLSKCYYKIVDRSESSNQIYYLALITMFFYDYLTEFICKFKDQKKLK